MPYTRRSLSSEDLVGFIRSAPVVVLAMRARARWRGQACYRRHRLQGAQRGTIRGDFSCSKSMNVIHASDSTENAAKELSIFFGPSDLVEYSRLDAKWVS
jgi:nucleoside-diphosphate kinase